MHLLLLMWALIALFVVFLVFSGVGVRHIFAPVKTAGSILWKCCVIDIIVEFIEQFSSANKEWDRWEIGNGFCPSSEDNAKLTKIVEFLEYGIRRVALGIHPPGNSRCVQRPCPLGPPISCCPKWRRIRAAPMANTVPGNLECRRNSCEWKDCDVTKHTPT